MGGLNGRGLLAAVALLLANTAIQAGDDWGPLFADNSPLAVTLTAPVRALAADRAAAPEYQAGEMSWLAADGNVRTVPVKLRPRGKNRRNPDTCRTPPLRLNLPTKAVANSVFAGQDKLKLVTHCAAMGNQRTSTHDRLQLELLAYRMLNLLTPASFRVRPLAITWQDADDSDRWQHPGFLIEHKDQVAARLGLADSKPEAINRGQLDAAATSLAALYQFMIGNTDFSFVRGPDGDACCHNLVLLQHPDGHFVPVPYDFDSTGLVNPPYAKPAAQLGLRRVTQRRYRGYCEAPQAFAATVATFQQQRASIEALVQDDPVLSDGAKRKAGRFLGGFFSLLDEPGRWPRVFGRHCR